MTILSFSLGFISGLFCLMLGAVIYAKRQPRKVAESMMKFEIQNEEQNLARLKKKVREAMNNG